MKRSILLLAALVSCGTENGPWSLDRDATMLDAGDRVRVNVNGSTPRRSEERL